MPADHPMYIVRFADGTQAGPIDKGGVRKLAQSGRLRPEDEVAPEGSQSWIKAGNIRGLCLPAMAQPGGSPIGGVRASNGGNKPSKPLMTGADTSNAPSQRVVIAVAVIAAAAVVLGTLVWFFQSQAAAARRDRQLAEVVEHLEFFGTNASDDPKSAIAEFETAARMAHALSFKIPPALQEQLDSAHVRCDAARLDLRKREFLQELQHAMTDLQKAEAETWISSVQRYLDGAKAVRVQLEEKYAAFPDSPPECKTGLERFAGMIAATQTHIVKLEDAKKVEEAAQAARRAAEELRIQAEEKERAAIAERLRKHEVEEEARRKRIKELEEERKKYPRPDPPAKPYPDVVGRFVNQVLSGMGVENATFTGIVPVYPFSNGKVILYGLRFTYKTQGGLVLTRDGFVGATETCVFVYKVDGGEQEVRWCK